MPLGVTSRSDLPVLFLGLFLGWLSLSWGAPIRVQEVPAAGKSGADRANGTTGSTPTPELARPWNMTQPPRPVPTVDPRDGASMGILAAAGEASTDDSRASTAAASADTTSAAPAAAGAGETAPAALDDGAVPAGSEDPASAAGESAPASSERDTNAVGDPCAKQECTPVIDVNTSVIESYKRHRAQAALIGDFGSCISGPGTGRKPDANSTRFTWTVDWGDDESYELKKDKIGPYQAEHIYAKKGKYTVAATFCHSVDGCDTSCASFSKTIKVKP